MDAAISAQANKCRRIQPFPDSRRHHELHAAAVLDFASGTERYIVEAQSLGRVRRIVQITTTMFYATTVASILLLVISAIVCWNVRWIINVPSIYLWQARWMFFLLFLGLIIRLFLSPLTVGLWARQRFVAINLILVAEQIFRAVLLYVLLVFVSSRVLLEAQAAGKPAVAYDVRGSSDVVDNEHTGLLVLPKDVDGFCLAVLRLLDDEDLCSRMGQAGQQKVMAHFSLDVSIQGQLSALSAILTKDGLARPWS